MVSRIWNLEWCPPLLERRPRTRRNPAFHSAGQLKRVLPVKVFSSNSNNLSHRVRIRVCTSWKHKTFFQGGPNVWNFTIYWRTGKSSLPISSYPISHRWHFKCLFWLSVPVARSSGTKYSIFLVCNNFIAIEFCELGLAQITKNWSFDLKNVFHWKNAKVRALGLFFWFL